MLPTSALMILTPGGRLPFRAMLAWLCLLLLAAGSMLPTPAAAQTRVDRADPALEATVTASPGLISIWFEQAVAAHPGAAGIEVIGSGGARQAIGPATVYSADPRHINAPVLNPLAPDTYVVHWTVRLAGEEVARSGAYGFRVGSAAVPGAATESGAFPAFWAVITRFLTLFGLALALGGFAVARFTAAPAASDPGEQRRRSLILGGAVLALLSTLAEPVFAALMTIPSPSIPSLVGTYPAAWWLRTGALLGLVLVATVALFIRSAPAGVARLLWLAGVVLGAVALAIVSMANVTAQLGPPTAVADGLMILVQVALVLLTGIAVHLALESPAPDSQSPVAAESPIAATGERSLQLYRWLMVALAAAGVVSVAVMSVLLLTGPGDLVGGLFAWLLIALAVLLVAIVVLGIVFRRMNDSGPGWGLAGLTGIALVGVAILGLSIPPGKSPAMASLAAVNLVAPVSLDVAGEPGLVHLLYQPAAAGENTFLVWLTNAGGEVLDVDEQPAFVIELQSLNQVTPPVHIAPAGSETNTFAVAPATLPDQGWWQANVTVTPPAGEPAAANFYLVLPDPNVHGFGPEPATSPEAEAVFDRGLAAMTGLRQVQFRTLIGGGGGTYAQSEITVNDGSDGSIRSYREQSASYETVILGDRQWLRQGAGDWSERQAGYIFTPAEWGSTYEHATGFALGPVVEMAGEPSQVVTFWLPRQEHPRQEPAWFAWWVGTETGQVHRETMISNRHYMVYDFAGFNQPVEITAPVSD